MGMDRFMTERYDVIVIGSGAGGGTLAHTVAPTGKKVLILERGRFPATRDWQLGPGFGLRGRSLYLS